MKKSTKIILIVLILIILTALIAGWVYLSTVQYYATEEALVAYEMNDGKDMKNYLEFSDDSEIGLIFYPGGKVESGSYSYLAELDNINVYIARFPFQLAFFNPNIAGDIIEDNPEVKSWFVGGHSLGGVAAYNYANNNPENIEGTFMLASYPASDYSQETTSFKNLAFFADNDGLVEDFKEKQNLFPVNTDFIEIKGGNHANFGDYGAQKNDKESSISKSEQHQIILSNTQTYIDENKD
jgi:hypothetical protein